MSEEIVREKKRTLFKREHVILFFIFLLVLAFRLYFAFQTPEFSSSESYFRVRQIQHILDTNKPLYNDPLSYGGRMQIFLPTFDYILTGFSLIFSGPLALKVLVNLFAASMVIVTYLITREITKNKEASLVTAYLSGFIPVYLGETLNNLSVFSIMVPLTFLFLYFFIIVRKDKRAIMPLLICLFMITILHTTVFLIVIGLIFYYLLTRIEKLEKSPVELEVMLFTMFFATWFAFIFFKKVLLAHGPAFVWQNIPVQLLSQYFHEFSLIEAISLVGLLPFTLGLYAGYSCIVEERWRSVFLLFGFAMATFLLLGTGLITLEVGLMYLAFTLVILFGLGYKILLVRIARSKFERYAIWFKLGMLLIITLTAVLPSLVIAFDTLQTAPSDEEVKALHWIRENTPLDAVVLGSLHDGHLITAIAQRKNVIDRNFLLIEDAEGRYEDVESILTTASQPEALRLLEKYGVTYIYQSGARSAPDTVTLPAADELCFKSVYPVNSTGPPVIEVLCRIEEVT